MPEAKKHNPTLESRNQSKQSSIKREFIVPIAMLPWLHSIDILCTQNAFYINILITETKYQDQRDSYEVFLAVGMGRGSRMNSRVK